MASGSATSWLRSTSAGKAGTQAELALMAELVPLLTERAGCDISGLVGPPKHEFRSEKMKATPPSCAISDHSALTPMK
jgi:hypothetical protein